MSLSPNIQAIICEEIFDESSHPSVEEIKEYATKIGIDPDSEPHLLHLAKEGLMQALPAPWKPCFDEKSKSYYYYNQKSGKTQWEHPLDDVYRNMVTKVRSGSQASFDEDSKNHEENTYTKEDLQSFEETLPKPPPFTKPILSPLKKLDSISLGARKKDIKLSPVKMKSKSMQDFSQKSNEFIYDPNFTKRRGSRTNIFDDISDNEKNIENKNFLLKNDKHPNSIEKGELTLSGGGSMFLKSNTKKTQENHIDNSNTKSSPINDQPKSLENDNLKSILRDRTNSLDNATNLLNGTTPTNNDDNLKYDFDERKSVRFNLITKDIDFNSEKSTTSDEEIENFIVKNVLIKSENKGRFTISPVFDEKYNLPKKTESIFEKIENAEKLEEMSSPRNTNLKLIKPNPTDFITPKLIIKPPDLSRPVLHHSDSDEDSGLKFKAKFPKEESIIIEKSIHIEDSIPEEDKSLEIPSERKELKDTACSPIQDVENEIKEKIHTELENEFEDYKTSLKIANEQKIKDYEQILLDSKRKAMEKLKNDIMDSQNLEFEQFITQEKMAQESRMKFEINKLQEKMKVMYDEAMKKEENILKDKLENSRVRLEKEYEKNIEYIENSFKDKEKDIENNFQMSLKQTEKEFLLKLEERIKEISTAHKAVIDRMKDDHNITIEELARDFKSEEEIIRREHLQNLADLKDKYHHELEIERQRMRDIGEDRLYEKVRCEKRLLEDKYRCLKEKYIRLKTEVKTSIEKRNRRKEQSATTTTGSDTEKSISHRRAHSSDRNKNSHDQTNKSNKSKQTNAEHEQNQNQNISGTPKHQNKQSDINSNRSKVEKNTRQITIEDLDTSMSEQSYHNPNDNIQKGYESSDGVSNIGRNRRKLFTRLKSSSTSRLNNNSGNKNIEVKRSYSPVENLRRQLQKLEDLEDQFPQAANQSDTYHLRYPFSDAGDIGGSSELEFFRHRIHLERDSVRRAKDNLRTQKTNFEKRQRELKLRHGSAARNTLQQLYQEERELSDMEVSLHRTRSLLGEKIIRLRHLEQSLQRISVPTKMEDATLSDLSSHSASSGISSTEFATATDNGKDENFQESTEIIQSLENLNSEIREIWDVLSKQQQTAPKVTAVMPSMPVPLVYSDQIWPVAGNITLPTLNAIPTLADRLQDYHQRAALATHGVQSMVVTQPPRTATQGAAVTTTLVERTKNLRDWLRQSKSDTGDNINPGQTTL